MNKYVLQTVAIASLLVGVYAYATGDTGGGSTATSNYINIVKGNS